MRMEDWRVERLQQMPSAHDFQTQIEAENMPVAFDGLVKHWPAFGKWNPATGGLYHLKAVSGGSAVQAMLSGDGSTFYGDIRSHERVTMLFEEFINAAYALNEKLNEKSSDAAPSHQVYLAQVPIHTRGSKEDPPLSSLSCDISVPECLEATTISNINLWMSSASSRSSIHYDPYHNVLCVVAGRKQVTLWPPSAAPYLYPMPVYGEASNHSEVDFVQPDYERFPRFRDASRHCQTVILNAGDGLFIPEGWFHQVDSDATTIAVNFWWPSKIASAFNTHMDGYYLRRILVSEDCERQPCGYREGQEFMLGRNIISRVSTNEDSIGDNELQEITLEELTVLEANQLQSIVTSVSLILENKMEQLNQEDPVAKVFSSSKPLSLRRILLVMVAKFPHTLEALVLHGLRPAAAELLTRKFEEMDSVASGSSQKEFYKRFYSVFDDPQTAMAALLNGKEIFAAMALSSVMDGFLHLSCKSTQ